MVKNFRDFDLSLPTKEQLKANHPYVKSPNGRRVLRSLFLELATPEVREAEITKPLFTVKESNVTREENGKSVVYWSLKNIYLSYDHVPGFEYEFAKDVFNSWDHWVLLADSADVVKSHIDAWRDEQATKLQARALQSLFKTAMFEGSKGTPAARYLADRGWEQKRGRPSKDEVEREKKIQAGVRDNLSEDMERLGLSIVKK